MAVVLTPVESPNAYANHEDLALYWKAVDDTNRADYLLKMVSNRLRQIADSLDINLDALVNDNAVYFLNVQGVVMESAKRALQAPTDQAPVETWQQTAGPYSENYKYSNPAGDIFFKKAELSLLGLYGRQKLNSISTVPNSAMYDSYESS